MTDLAKTNDKLDIRSFDITIKDIVEEGMLFNIPIYQRLYVWSNDQIKTLLSDLKEAINNAKDGKYYLGSLILMKNNEERYDLIDGQQRFITLWLISNVLNSNPLNDFLYDNSTSRISFSVRDFAKSFFNNEKDLSEMSDNERDELVPVINALKTINNWYNDNFNDLSEGFAYYIYNNIRFIATEMPRKTDVNKVFEAMNNRGVQLKPHEILKSKLLEKITDSKLRYKYSLLWDACSIMDNYIEKNIKEVANLKWKQLFPEIQRNEEEQEILRKDIFNCIETQQEKQEENRSNEENKLLNIINKHVVERNDEKEDEKEYDSGSVRSIISFPMLLLHVLRIFQFRYIKEKDDNAAAPVKEKALIDIFNSFMNYFSSQEDVTNFLDLLWDIREKFDRFVIKWVTDENDEETHLIKRLYQNESALQRQEPESNEGFALLQSMLYHSQEITTHYWLTPFLNKMVKEEDETNLYKYLEKLDDAMFCKTKEDLRRLSYRMMKVDTDKLKGDNKYVKNILRSHLGTGFSSYWFYKLEYILWKNRMEFKKEEWEEYKITAKNSVEHISPQNPNRDYSNNTIISSDDDYNTKIRKQDDFGNLVLIAPCLNSEYSNKIFTVKRDEFRNKLRIDSLKSALIFQNDRWNWELCERHRESMIDIFLKHLNNK